MSFLRRDEYGELFEDYGFLKRVRHSESTRLSTQTGCIWPEEFRRYLRPAQLMHTWHIMELVLEAVEREPYKHMVVQVRNATAHIPGQTDDTHRRTSVQYQIKGSLVKKWTSSGG